MAKPKVAFYWCASCGGCEETVIDLNADLLNRLSKVATCLTAFSSEKRCLN